MLGGLHTLLFLVLGFVFVGVQADCTDKLKGNSCDHLTDARRRQLRKDEEACGGVRVRVRAVSYTHLTLPTILRV